MLKMSLQNDIPISLSDIIPLHLVSGSSSPYGYFMAKALLEQGSDPNARDSSCLTPVHVAASWGNYETLKLLLSNGGNPYLEDDDGKTPLDLALQEDRVECIKLLSWWMKNAHESAPSTPTSNHQLQDDRLRCHHYSPTVFGYSTPTSSPSYRPKYFSSPVSGSPNSQLSSGGRSPAASSRNCCGRRVLRYEETPENHAFRSDNDHDSRKSGNLVPMAIRENAKGDEQGNDEKAKLKPANKEDSNLSSPLTRANMENQAAVDNQKSASSLHPSEIIDANNSDGLLNKAMNEFSQLWDDTVKLSGDKKQVALAMLETTIQEENREIDPKRLSECNKLTDADLRRQAINQGLDVGPITPGTRFLYVRRLAGLLSSHKTAEKRSKYSPELQAAIEGRLNEAKCREDEAQLLLSFDNPLNGGIRQWREGCLKMSFCYLLLDPTVTKNLPGRAADLSESQRLQTFVDAIFYVGKGKKARPLRHLLEAAGWNPDVPMKNAKMERITSLWDKGYGVISLHVFHNIMPVEAYSREAAMIDAVGLDRLCNAKRGDYYGASANWSLGRRRRYGAYLLKLAASIFFLEGEKQLKREDVLKPSSG